MLATPSLADGTFDRSVIFIAEHSSTDGALGIILNHPSQEMVSGIFPDSKYQAIHHLPIHHGGPLSQEKLIFSSLSEENDQSISLKLQITPEQALNLISKPNHIILATRGYSAWSPGQLEGELIQNTWITSKATSDLITHPHDLNLWKTLLGKISPYHKLLTNAPKSPFLN